MVFPEHLYFLGKKSTQHGPDVLLGSTAKSPSAACTLVPLRGGRLAAEHIMPELFRATGSLNFRIRPRSFALGRSLTASKPTEEEKGICLPCGSIVMIRMLPSTVTMTCG